jgi:protein FRG1
MAYDGVRRGTLKLKGGVVPGAPYVRTIWGVTTLDGPSPLTASSAYGHRVPAAAGVKRKADGGGGGAATAAAAAAAAAQGWVRVAELADLTGPLFVCVNGAAKCIAVTEDGEVRLQRVPPSQEPDHVGPSVRAAPAGVCVQAVTRVGTGDAGQVLVGHSIQPNVYVFKSAYGRYLSADRYGLVSATAEAIGPQQEWVPVLRDDGLALQSKYDKFLGFEDERNSVRADSESAGFREVFAVQCQAARRAERRKQALSSAAVADKPVNELENESAYVPPPIVRACMYVYENGGAAPLAWSRIGKWSLLPDVVVTDACGRACRKRFQSWGMGRVRLANDATDLQVAAREGTLSGALLDRRAKVKSDKYCK